MTLLHRIGSPIAWSAADKCLLAWLLTVALAIPCGLLGTYHLHHPEIVPYVDLDFAASVTLPFVRSYSALGVAMAVLAFLLRRRRPEVRGLVYATTGAICLGSGLTFSWMFGHFTSPMAIDLLATLAVLGCILFDLRPMLFGLGLWLIGAVAITVAEQAGRIRYAPLFVDSPVHAGRLSTAWLLGWGDLARPDCQPRRGSLVPHRPLASTGDRTRRDLAVACAGKRRHQPLRREPARRGDTCRALRGDRTA